MNGEQVAGDQEVEVAGVPMFGARRRARELVKEVTELRAQLDRLGGLTVIELEAKRAALESEVGAQQAQIESDTVEAAAALEQQAMDAGAALKADLADAEVEKRALEAVVVGAHDEGGW